MRKDRVALVGFMGAGKSTVGRVLAGRLGCDLVDLDQQLERDHGPIAAPSARDGEASFRAREAAAVAAWVEQDAAGILALGGGAFHLPSVREALWGRVRTVFLDVPLDVARARVGTGRSRPLWDASVDARFLQRQPGYCSAELRVDATGSVETVVDRVLDALAVPSGEEPVSVSVALARDPYEVWVAGGLAGLGESVRRVLPTAAEGVVLVSDDQVAPLWADAVARELSIARQVVLPAGEAHKGWASLQAVVDGILAGPTHRGTVVVALGGGVVGDVAGLGAALALRGVPIVQIPTTLLAMVDASVGGKTAINHERGKNLVGAFHQPALVWAASATLGTLDLAERLAGWGEVAKIALIGDPALLAAMPGAEADARDGAWAGVEEAVRRCVAVKARVVVADARERGVRVWLNAGHTVAHGLETALGHGTLSHGHAVALGLLAELRWAIAEGVCEDPGLYAALEAALGGVGLDLDVPRYDRDAALVAMGLDKKGTGRGVKLPLPRRAGEMTVIELPRERLGELLPCC